VPPAASPTWPRTTVCINAASSAKARRTGLVTTQGMRDLSSFGARSVTISTTQADKPAPLVLRTSDESAGADAGERDVATPLEIDAVRSAVGALAAQGVEALAVCFLHSYVNPRTSAPWPSSCGETSPISTFHLVGRATGVSGVRAAVDDRQNAPWAR